MTEVPFDESDSADSNLVTIEAQLSELQEQVYGFKESQKALAEQIVQLMGERSALRDELELVTDRSKKVAEQAAEVDHVSQFAENLREARGAKIKAENAATELQAKLAAALADLDEIRRTSGQDLINAQESLKASQHNNSDLQTSINRLRADLQERNQLVDKLSSNIETLVGSNEELKGQISTAHKQLTETQTENNDLGNKLKEKESALVGQAESHTKVSTQLRELTYHVGQLKQEADQTEKNVAKQKEEADHFLVDIRKTLNNEIAQAKARTKHVEDALKLCEAQLAIVSQELSNERAVASSSTEALKEAQSRANFLREESKRLENRVRHLESSHSGEREALEKELMHTRKEAQQASKLRLEKAEFAVKLAKLTARAHLATSSTTSSRQNGLQEGAEFATIERLHFRLTILHSPLEPNRIILVLECNDATQDPKSIALTVQADEYARDLPAHEMKRHGSKVQYYLHHYFSELMDYPDRHANIDDIFISTLLRLLNEDTIRLIGLSNVTFDYSVKQVLTISQKVDQVETSNGNISEILL